MVGRFLKKKCSFSLTQWFIESNLDAGLIPVITLPTRVTHTSATLLDSILISHNLLGSHSTKVLIDDMSDQFPNVLDHFNPNDTKTEIVKD